LDKETFPLNTDLSPKVFFSKIFPDG
ncbi:uncharacterized protein METZ01_LOCUS386833, partial [marine metagenome]